MSTATISTPISPGAFIAKIKVSPDDRKALKIAAHREAGFHAQANRFSTSALKSQVKAGRRRLNECADPEEFAAIEAEMVADETRLISGESGYKKAAAKHRAQQASQEARVVSRRLWHEAASLAKAALAAQQQKETEDAHACKVPVVYSGHCVALAEVVSSLEAGVSSSSAATMKAFSIT